MKWFQKVFFLLLIGYLLGISDGYIALWEDAAAAPVQVFPYRAQMLPPADQEALKNGIHITGEQELIQLLEDYLS